MSEIKLRSDWRAEIPPRVVKKTKLSAQSHQTLFPRMAQRVGSGDETTRIVPDPLPLLGVGSGHETKVRPWQLMRQSTPLVLCGSWKVRREERCEVGVTVVRWCCHTHTGNEVSSCVGRVVERLRSLCVYFGPVFNVGFRWTSGGQSTLG